jgi:tetratricopeptide (TPR) repeat protein
LHARFAGWLEARAGDLVELDEIVGYHFEQAYRYRLELGLAGEDTYGLAQRAAERLARGGREALGRHDIAAAASLLGRAAELLPEQDAARPDLLTDLARTLFDHGETGAAARRAAEAMSAAKRRGDEGALARAELQRLAIQAQVDPAGTVSDVLPRIEAMIARLEELGDHAALADAWGVLGRFQFFVGNAAAAERSYGRSIDYARLSGNLQREQETTQWLIGAKRYGPAPVDEVLAFIDECAVLAIRDTGTEVWRAALSSTCAAMQGRFNDARNMLDASQRLALELGMEVRRLGSAMEGGQIELLAGDPQAAVAQLRAGYDGLGRLGETGFRSTVGTFLAEALERLGRDDEAEVVLRECEAIAQGEDFDPQARLRYVRARMLARRGNFKEAERLAREAVAIMAPTDYLDTKGHAYVALADVLASAGRSAEAAQALAEAAALFERKGDLISTARTHDQIAALGSGDARISS